MKPNIYRLLLSVTSVFYSLSLWGQATVTIQQPVLSTPINCYAGSDGTVTVSIDTAGGVQAPFTYTIIRVSGPTTVTIPPSAATPYPGCSSLFSPAVKSSSELTITFTGLCPGTYVVAAQDANGVDDPLNPNVIVGNRTLLNTVLNGASPLTMVKCNGAATGAISVRASGGVSGVYDFELTGPSFPSGSGFQGSGANNFTFTGLLAGTYSIVGRDVNGCVDPTPLTATLTGPAALSVTAFSASNSRCTTPFNGSIDATITGGVGPYTYAWTGPNGFTATTEDVLALEDGSYNVVVTDANNCTTSKIITVADSKPTIALTTTVGDNSRCLAPFNGAINLSVAGSAGPFTYAWTGASGFTASTEDLSTLVEGTYSVTVTDNTSGCTATASVTVANAKPILTLTNASVSNSRCLTPFDGSINLTTAGSVGPFTYAWTGPNGFTSAIEDPATLENGTYSITVTDNASGCTATASMVVGNSQPTLTLTNATISNSRCVAPFNGSVNLTVAGSAGPFTYAWTGPSGFTASTEDLSTLLEGTYNVTVTDNASGCTATTSVTVGNTKPVLALTNTSVNNSKCVAPFNGSVNLTVAGSAGPFTYAWTGPGGFTASTEDLSALLEGAYNVTITDITSGCTATASVTVGSSKPTLSLANTTVSNSQCVAPFNGSINLTVAGSAGPFTYAWTGPSGFTASTEDLSTLLEGTYSVIVTDNASGCTATTSVTVGNTKPVLALTNTSINNSKCVAPFNGSVNLTVAGSVGPFTYAWTGPSGFTASTQDLNALLEGTYNVTVTDNASACTATASVTVGSSKPTLSLANTTVSNSKCVAPYNGSVNLTVAGSAGPFTYSWTGPSGFTATTEDITAISNGDYTIIVTENASGCTTTATITVGDGRPVLALTNNVISNSRCVAPFDGAINLTVSGSAGPFTYAWTGPGSFTVNTEDISAVVEGTYDVTVTDAGGCTATASVTVGNSKPTLSLTNTTISNSRCVAPFNGSVSLAVAGNSGAVTYAWTGPSGFTASTQNLAKVVNGVYSVTVTDNNSGCTATASATVGNNQSTIVLGATAVNSTNCVTPNGSINLTITGGVAPYTYVWSNGAATQNISGLNAGSYSVTVTDASGCTATVSSSITAPPAITLSAVTTNSTSCVAPNGTIDVTVAGGTAPFTYAWSNGAAVDDINGLVGGTYNLTVTDAAGCTATLSQVISGPPAITLSAVVANATSCITPDGAVNLTVTGGTAPYTFSWSNAVVTEDIIGIAAGSYTVTVTDASGCTATLTRTVAGPVSATLTATATNSTNCITPNGAINLTVSGGKAPYTFAWSNSATTEDLTGLAAGTYFVTVTDANGCTSTFSQSISGPTVITLTAAATNSTSCPTPNGAIDLTATGGTAPYTYVWNNGVTTQDLAGLAAGTYSVTVTDAGGCTATFSRVITDPAGITLTATSVNSNNCVAHNGSINLTVTGGQAPFTYSWSNGSTKKNINGLPGGTYTVTVTDKNGCTATLTQTITSPGGITLSASATNSTSCPTPDGSITLAISGGVAPYTYSWSNGAVTQNLTGLSAGNYTVVVTDANACSATITQTVTDPAGMTLAAATSNSTSCATPDGTINLTVSGGTAPYAYVWSNGATTQNLTGLSAGTYVVTVTDANGCTASITRSVTDPAGIILTASATNSTSCIAPDGSIDLTVSSGTAPYTYSWSNGATVQDLSNLAAGSYSVTVTDAKGCTVTLVRTITDPAGISLTAGTVNSTNCITPNGSIAVTVTGGGTPYAYSWSNGATTQNLSGLSAGTYTVTVVDANGCSATITKTITDPSGISLTASAANSTSCIVPNGSVTLTVTGGAAPFTYAWSNGATTQNLSGLAAGNYTVTVTDASGCSATLTKTINDPGSISLTASIANSTSCATPNGSITLSVSGGATPYTYAWSNGSTSQNLTGLSAGSYSVVVTDVNGCQATLNRTITAPNSATLTASVVNSTNCATPNGNITLTVTGGTAPYTYLWSNGATTQNLSNLAAGSYSVTVTDASGCQATLSKTVTDPAGITLTASAANSTNCTTPNGSITLTVSGGIAPFTYSWSNGATTQNLSGLSSGSYSVTVTDAKGCQATLSRTITDPAGIVLSAASANSTSCTNPNGSVNMTVSGGASPYTYSWSNGATSQNLASVSAGNYTVIVTDASGCTATISANVTDPAGITLSTNSINSTSCSTPNGVITVSVSGGVAPYTFVWNNGATTQNLTGLSGGTYAVIVTDAGGCTATISKTITDPSGITLTANAVNSTDCKTANGSISLTVSSGTAPYSYLWGNGATTKDVANLAAGSYSVTVTDANGCTATLTRSITAPANTINLSATSANSTSCASPDGSITLVVSGGLAPFTYKWSNGATTQNLTGLSAGSYSVTVTDASGCQSTLSKTILDPAGMTLAATVSNSTSCQTPNGAVNLTVNGGIAPYSYSWSNGASSQNISNLPAGTYGVTVTDANGCQAFLSRSLTDPAGILLTAVPGNATSCTTPDGTIQLTITGGAAPYTFQWNTGATTQNLSGLAAGAYSVLVKDANGCQAIISQVISDPGCTPVCTLAATATATNSTNCTASNGTITLTVTGGTAPFTYSWSNGATSQNLAGLAAGSYTVTVTDAKGCQAVVTKTITDPSGITLAASVTNSTNCTTPNGSISLTVTGGVAPFSYSWSNGATTQNLSGLSAGTYTVTVMDANGCSAVIAKAVTDPAGILLSSTTGNSTSCANPNGSITVAVTGGKAPFTYSWSNGATTQNVSNLPAGFYMVTVTDVNGCTGILTTTITDPSGISLNATVNNSTNCTTPNGSINVSVSGGVAPYTYTWSNGATTQNLTSLAAGTYTVTVKDANGCQAILTKTITDPSGISLMAITVNSTDCTTPNGSITLTLTGGVAPFTYAWSNGATTQNLNSLSAGTYSVIVKDANGCQATLTRTVTGAGTAQSASVSISASQTTICANTAVTFTATPTNGGSTPTYQWRINGSPVAGATTSIFTSSTLVNSDKVTVVMTAAGTGIGCISGSPATSNQVGITVTNSLTASVTIAASQTSACPGTAISFTATPTNGGTVPTYQWQVNGTNVSGATAAMFTSSTLTNTDKVTVVMKPDVSGSGSCINPAAVTSNQVAMTISNNLPAGVSISASATTVCTGTAVTFTATPTNGGSAPTYQWLVNGLSAGATGATFTSSTLSNNDKVSVVMTAGGSGVSCVTGSPAVSNQLTITISNSLAASVSIAASQTAACPNTAITFTAIPTNGGSAPTYQWQVNGNPVAGAIAATFTSSTLANSDKVTVVMTAGGSGTGCISGSPATSNAVTMTISNSLTPSVSIAASASGPFCAGSSVTFTATPTNGGTAPAYVWKVNGTVMAGATNATFTSSTLNSNDMVTAELTPDVSGAGSCIVPGTVNSNAVTVSVKLASDPSCGCNLDINVSSNPVTCQNDSDGEAIAIVLSGSSAGINQYLFSLNGGTPESVDSFFKKFLNQPAGPFSITVTDRNNTACSLTESNIITSKVSMITPVLPISPTCAGNDGQLNFETFQTTNTKKPFRISIDGGQTFYATATGDTTFNNLAAGTYNIVISDGTPCTVSFAVTLKNPSLVTPSVAITTPSPTVCAGQAVTFTAKATNGGNSPLYQWKVNGVNVGTNSTTSTFTSSTLTSTDAVTVTMMPDLSGAGSCINPAAVNSNTLSVAPSNGLTPSVSISTPNPAVCTGAAVTFMATPTNGGAAPKYQWKVNGVNVGTNSTTSTFTSSTLTSSDVVTVMMTPDVTGTGSCINPAAVTSNSLSVTVSSTSLTASVSISTPSSTVCVGTAVTFTATPTNGGTAPKYQWKLNGTTDVGTNSATFTSSTLTSSDVVTVVMTPDVSGAGSCIVAGPVTSNNLSVTVSSSITPTVSIAPNTPSICAGGTVTFTATVTNAGTAPKFQWKLNGTNVGTNSATYTNSALVSSDVVTVVVTPDASGAGSCIIPTAITSNTSSVTVKPAGDPSCACNITAQAFSTSVLCTGQASGQAVVTNISGGSGSYEYSIDNGQTFQSNPSFNGLPAGSYTIIVRDVSSITCKTTTTVSVGTQFSVGAFVLVNPDPLRCGEKGYIKFDFIYGGVEPYQVSIDSTVFYPYPATTIFNNLDAGTYKVTVKDANGCVFTRKYTITGVSAIVATLSKNDVTCNSGSNGVVTITNPSGGANNGYVYSMDGTNYSGTSSFTGLRAGSYTFYVKDAAGTCLQSFDVAVSEPEKIVAMVTPTQPTSCQSADGKIVAKVTSGGLAPFTYRLNTGTFQSDSTFTTLGNGDYTLTVRDANGCESPYQVKLVSAGAITATATVISPASCNGKADGSAQLTNMSGGTGTYEYSKDGITYQDSPLFSNLKSGNYLLMVRDKGIVNGCTASYLVTIGESIQITAAVSVSQIPSDCNSRDGAISIANVNGGLPGYQYSLDSLLNYQTTPSFTGLGNGNYKVFIRDTKGCLGIYAVRLTAPNAIQVGSAITLKQPSCPGSNDGNIDMNPAGTNVTGGQPAYQYSLNGGAFQPASLFRGLVAGTYQIIVKDQANCALTFTYTLTDPAGLNLEVVQTSPAGCGGSNGAIEVKNVSGGIAPYSFSMNNQDFYSSPIFGNLTAGSYKMYVRDASQQTTCVTTKNFNVLGSTTVTFDISTLNIGCEGGAKGRITVKNIVGGLPAVGTARYKASINGGLSFRDLVSDSLVFDNLMPGDYKVILTYGENLGCSTEVRPVTITSAGIFFTVKTTAATCGEANGMAEVVVPNANPNYSYSLEPNTGFRPSPTFTDLQAGVYTMYIRTGAVETCPNQQSFIIPGPAKLTYKFKKNNSCEGDGNSGSIVFTDIAGGALPYKVSIDNGANFSFDIYQNNYAVGNLKTGDYQIIISDAAGCKTLAVPVKIEESRMRARLRVEPSLLDESTGSVLVQDIRGGTPTYEVSVDGLTWASVHSPKLDTLIQGLSIGSYILFIRDDNGCIKEFPFTILESLFTVPNIFTPNGDTYNDTFRIRNLPDGSTLSIVNRWGKVVYESNNYQNDWTGDTLSDGIYYYNLNVPGKGPFSGWVEVRRGVK